MELNAFGVEINVAILEEGGIAGAFPAGRQEIAALIRRLSDRYMGCFIFGLDGHTPDFDKWIHWLRTFHKPVGVFEGSDEQGLPPRLTKGCFGVYLSLGKVACMALDIIHAAGHRDIALVTNRLFGATDWFALRRKMLLDQARSYNDRTAIQEILMSDPPDLAPRSDEWTWKHTAQRMQERIEHICALRGGQTELTKDDREAIRLQLIHDQPSLENLISQHRQTAVIAANDEVAVDFVLWMKYTGRAVPNDMSLISFDNNPVLALHQFSTIDFGCANLGYLLAHRFIGDIPIPKDANGNITVTPRLFDRGSIARPLEQRRVKR